MKPAAGMASSKVSQYPTGSDSHIKTHSATSGMAVTVTSKMARLGSGL